MQGAVVNGWFWLLDYVYIASRQLRGFFDRTDPASYRIHGGTAAGHIVIIPGIYEKWNIMEPIAATLFNQGYDIHVIDGLGYNTGSIEVMAAEVRAYVHRHRIKEYAIVAHSKGGLIAKYLMADPANHITKVVAINTPFTGSKYALLFPYNAMRTFLPSSPIITSLSKDIQSNGRITSIYGIFDPHIPGGSYLEGATNIRLPVRGHFRPIRHKVVHDEVLRALHGNS